MKISPSDWTEEIIQDPNFIYVCNSGNNFENSEVLLNSDYFQINGKNAIDPITLEPIPLNLLVSVKSISDTQFKNSIYFNAEFLYKYWVYKPKYPDNPVTRGYFNSDSVNFVIDMLIRLNKL